MAALIVTYHALVDMIAWIVLVFWPYLWHKFGNVSVN